MYPRSSVIIAAALAVFSTFDATIAYGAAGGAHHDVQKPRFLQRNVKRQYVNTTTPNLGSTDNQNPEKVVDQIIPTTTPLPTSTTSSSSSSTPPASSTPAGSSNSDGKKAEKGNTNPQPSTTPVQSSTPPSQSLPLNVGAGANLNSQGANLNVGGNTVAVNPAPSSTPSASSTAAGDTVVQVPPSKENTNPDKPNTPAATPSTTGSSNQGGLGGVPVVNSVVNGAGNAASSVANVANTAVNAVPSVVEPVKSAVNSVVDGVGGSVPTPTPRFGGSSDAGQTVPTSNNNGLGGLPVVTPPVGPASQIPLQPSGNPVQSVGNVVNSVAAAASSVAQGLAQTLNQVPASITSDGILVANPTLAAAASALNSAENNVQKVVNNLPATQPLGSVPASIIAGNTLPAGALPSGSGAVVVLPSGGTNPATLTGANNPLPSDGIIVSQPPAALITPAPGSVLPSNVAVVPNSVISAPGSVPAISQPAAVISAPASQVSGAVPGPSTTLSNGLVVPISAAGSLASQSAAAAALASASAASAASAAIPAASASNKVQENFAAQPTPAPANSEKPGPTNGPVATGSQTYPANGRGPNSQMPTAYDSNTALPVQSSIIFNPSSAPAATGTQAVATGLPSDVPLVLYPPGPKAKQPPNTALIQIGFLFPLNYDFVWTHEESQRQIFTYLPIGVSYSLTIDRVNVTMQTLRAWDTTQDLHYITTLALMWIPADLVDALQLAVTSPTGKFHNHPDASIRTLMSMVNTAIPVRAGNLDDSHTQSGTTSNTMSTAGAAPIGGGINNSSPVKASSVGIGVGVVCGAAAYGAAMFFVARRYRKRRRSHARSPSMFSSPVMSHAGADPAAGQALMSGAMGAERSISPYHDRAESRGSGRTGGSSGRQQISAPVMAENSLGWN